MRDQLRCSAISICSNIAEGDERQTNKESVRFFYIAKGSFAELATQIEIAYEVNFLLIKQYRQLTTECTDIANMLGALIKARS